MRRYVRPDGIGKFGCARGMPDVGLDSKGILWLANECFSLNPEQPIVDSVTARISAGFVIDWLVGLADPCVGGGPLKPAGSHQFGRAGAKLDRRGAGVILEQHACPRCTEQRGLIEAKV